MPPDAVGFEILSGVNFALLVKAFFILFVVFYSVFALIQLRQIQLMERTIELGGGRFLKFLAIIQIGITLAILLIVIGTF